MPEMGPEMGPESGPENGTEPRESAGPRSAEADASQARLDRFFERLVEHPWFSAVGQPPAEPETADARQVIEGLMAGDPTVAWVSDLNAAAALLRRDDHSRAWASAEQEEVARLTARVEDAFGADAATDGLNRAMHRASDAAIGPAAVACARAGIADEALPKVAAGAASQSAYEMALVLGVAADPARHPFAARFRLFAAGRWPLTVAGGAFHVL